MEAFEDRLIYRHLPHAEATQLTSEHWCSLFPLLGQWNWWWSWPHPGGPDRGFEWSWPLLHAHCATPAAQKPLRSIARYTEDWNRDWKCSFISCSHPPIPSWAAMMGKFPFASEHCTPPLGVFGAWRPWLTNRKTIFKNHLQKQQILLPPCTALEKQCQHVSSEDWFSVGLRVPAKRPQLAVKSRVSSIASTSGTVTCLG